MQMLSRASMSPSGPELTGKVASSTCVFHPLYSVSFSACFVCILCITYSIVLYYIVLCCIFTQPIYIHRQWKRERAWGGGYVVEKCVPTCSRGL